MVQRSANDDFHCRDQWMASLVKSVSIFSSATVLINGSFICHISSMKKSLIRSSRYDINIYFVVGWVWVGGCRIRIICKFSWRQFQTCALRNQLFSHTQSA